MTVVSLKEDYAFKEFFEHVSVLKQFISDVTGIPLEEIRRVGLRSPFLRRRYRWEKLGILDVMVELNNDTKIDIEMQVEVQKYWHQRNLYYLAKMYTDDIRSGEDYSRLRRCITISILDFNLTEDPQCHSVYTLRDERGREYSRMFEVHIIELKKVPAREDPLLGWVRLFNARTQEDLRRLGMDSIRMKNAIEVLRDLNPGRRWRWLYESRLKARRDRQAREEYVRDEGRAEGRAEGITIGIQQGVSEGEARKLVSLVDGLRENMNVNLETACKMLGVSKEEYEKAIH